MKKALCIIAAVSVVASLISCAKPTEPETEVTTQPTTQTQDALPLFPMTSVSVPSVTETVTASNGAAVFHYVYPNLSLTLPEAEVAKKITLDHLNRLDAHQSAKDAIAAGAQAAYTPGQAFTPYLFSVHYNPMRIDTKILSFSGITISYQGGGHPDQLCFGLNYNLVTGETLTLGSILKQVDSKKALEELVLEALGASNTHSALYDNYPAVVRQRFMQDESYDENWYFSNKGLCIFFSPYEIAPYTSGVIVAEMPYASLRDIISEEYFPTDRIPAVGALKQIPIQEADITQFTQISELVLIPESDKTLYYTDTSIYDIRITQTNDITGYRSAIFAAYGLSAGDALMIEAPSNIRNTLTISYVSGDKTTDISY